MNACDDKRQGAVYQLALYKAMDLLALTWQVETHLSFAHTVRLSIGEHHLWHIQDDIFGSEVRGNLRKPKSEVSEHFITLTFSKCCTGLGFVSSCTVLSPN